MPAIVDGAKMYGLAAYLFGPGRANEHTNPRVIAASSERVFAAGGGGQVRDAGVAGDLADALDEARVVFGTEVVRQRQGVREAREREGWPAKQAVALAEKHEHVWHCSLSLSPEEGAISDEKWAQIAGVFMERIGFSNVGGGVADAQWAAVHHGGTKDGGDHIHIIASRVRDDGTIVPKYMPFGDRENVGDWVRAHAVAGQIEREFGLQLVPGHSAELSQRGLNKAERARAAQSGALLTEREELVRRVRAAASSSRSEAQFVAAVRGQGVRIRPRYAKGDTGVVVGYSVALRADAKGLGSLALGQSRMAAGDKAIWYGGGRLAKDLTLTQLRNGWGGDEQSRQDALAVWKKPASVGAAARASGKSAESLRYVQKAMGALGEYIGQLPADDHAGWYELSRTAAGMLSQLSLRDGGDAQLAAAARSLDACSGTLVEPPASPEVTQRRRVLAQATMRMALALGAGNSQLMYALVLKQLSDTCRAIADARAAGVDAHRAHALRATAELTLAKYQQALAGVGGESGIESQIRGIRAADVVSVAAPNSGKSTTGKARPAGPGSADAVPPVRRRGHGPSAGREGPER